MQPIISVGIMFAPIIRFRLNGDFKARNLEGLLSGVLTAELKQPGQVILSDSQHQRVVSLPLILEPDATTVTSFDLTDVTIGINFHWERKEDQRFTGALKIIEENGHLTAINMVPIEEYLKSVISSEMSATSNQELLKAHAVVSRSWLLAQIEKSKQLLKTGKQASGWTNHYEHIRWYDREDHENFDVCADDHCQRYQGITRATTEAVNEAINATAGLILTYHNQICDARYSKSCGGISELFENVWEPVHHPYLTMVVDNDKNPVGFDTHLNSEEQSRKWITSSPEAFCNTQDKAVLSQVLNDYDQETADFYRWTKEYTQDKLRSLLKKRIGIDVGKIKKLIPVERGASARLIKLKIVGTEKEIVIGKELEIRKAFSESHLYSSAFVVDHEELEEGIPQKFIFTGAGWGHGVGFCQIGAAVMGAQGYTHEQILMHYFKGASLEKLY